MESPQHSAVAPLKRPKPIARPQPKRRLHGEFTVAPLTRGSSSSRLAFNRFHQPTDVGPDYDLVSVQLRHLFRYLANRRQMSAAHMRASRVVIGDPFGRNVVQVPLAEENESLQAFSLDALNETLAASIGLYRRMLLMGVLTRDGFA